MIKKGERLTSIINTLLLDNAASIRDLSQQLEVSEMTVRRDLHTLAADNVVKLVHGAAVLNPNSRPDSRKYTLTQQTTLHTEEKMRIGRKAAGLLKPNDIIIIDSGSTTDYLARAVPYSLPLTVLCFSLNILIEIQRKQECRLTFAGGEFHENTLMFESAEGMNLIKRYRATKAFISAAGISARLGVTCSTQYEVEFKRASIHSALHRVLLVDSSKFERIQTGYFADLKDFDIVVTDSGIPPEYADLINDLGIELIIA